MAGKANAPNWKKIKAEYIRGGISQQKLAEKYGISYNTLRNHARKERWGELRNETDQKVTQNLPQKIADSQVTILVELSGFQDEATVALYKKLLGSIQAFPENAGTKTIRETVEVKTIKLEDGTEKKIPLRSSFTSDLESAVRTIATLGRLYGLDAASVLNRQRFEMEHEQETPDDGDDAIMEEIRARVKAEKVNEIEHRSGNGVSDADAAAGGLRPDAGIHEADETP